MHVPTSEGAHIQITNADGVGCIILRLDCPRNEPALTIQGSDISTETVHKSGYTELKISFRQNANSTIFIDFPISEKIAVKEENLETSHDKIKVEKDNIEGYVNPDGSVFVAPKNYFGQTKTSSEGLVIEKPQNSFVRDFDCGTSDGSEYLNTQPDDDDKTHGVVNTDGSYSLVNDNGWGDIGECNISCKPNDHKGPELKMPTWSEKVPNKHEARVPVAWQPPAEEHVHGFINPNGTLGLFYEDELPSDQKMTDDRVAIGAANTPNREAEQGYGAQTRSNNRINEILWMMENDPLMKRQFAEHLLRTVPSLSEGSGFNLRPFDNCNAVPSGTTHCNSYVSTPQTAAMYPEHGFTTGDHSSDVVPERAEGVTPKSNGWIIRERSDSKKDAGSRDLSW